LLRSKTKGTLLEKQSTLSAVSLISFKIFSYSFMSDTRLP
jgi:hypothetical protein